MDAETQENKEMTTFEGTLKRAREGNALSQNLLGLWVLHGDLPEGVEVDCTSALTTMAAFTSYSTVDWPMIDTLYYRPYNCDWPEEVQARILPEFPNEYAGMYWNRLQNAKTYFYQQTLPLRAVWDKEAVAQLDKVEAEFDSLFVEIVSQEYYLRLCVDCYEEHIPAAINACF